MAAPVADGLAAGVTEGHVAGGDGMHRGTEHTHTLHVGMLALHIGLAHEDFTLHTHQRTHRGCGDAMLAGTGFGDDARLAHVAGKEYLTDGVVDFVSSGMVEVFALEVKAATIAATHTVGIIEGRRTPHIVAQQLMVLALEFIAAEDVEISILQVVHTLV